MFRKKVSEVVRKELKITETTWKVIKDYGKEKCRNSKVKLVYGYDELLNMPMQESYTYVGYQQGEKKREIYKINPFKEAAIVQVKYTYGAPLVQIFYYVPSVLTEALDFKHYYMLKSHLRSNWEFYSVYSIESGELHPVSAPKDLRTTQEIICISKQKFEYAKGEKAVPVSMIMTYF